MRQILIDDLSREEWAVVDNFLKRNARPGPIDGMYWLPLPAELLSATQQEHGDCAPFCCGIELGEAAVAFELLVRSQAKLHCDCIAYATPEQRAFLLAFVDRLVAEERITA
ncbi:MAG: hypothetical protein COZ12_06705 [Deltaproteobacteria bacterium CG_4_10_14_3_um_filter_60_8]|nr:MAG: hypothetical protein AUK28_00450 [Desulfobacterales bacterium CG2_30_60_27]PIP44385.1 MAG: hypothetical protein COX17_01770 [Deltaproteobacteria bacterium CG23_combo_of_CG06-09_8_20_14_all_60_8]PIY21073.1 MAG: hypothetical protein COZ12_06705 [Deltaproteobacteria bacterium CG_4_10_14_3_um_filter_60_8]